MSKARERKLRDAFKGFSYIVGSKLTVAEYPEPEDGEDTGMYILILTTPTRESNRRRRHNTVVSTAIFTEPFFFRNGRIYMPALKQAFNIVCRMQAEHELEEWMRYKGKSLHSPHFVPQP